MAPPRAWIMLKGSDWTKVPLETDKYQVDDVDDLKEAIKSKLPDIITFSASLLTIKAVKKVNIYKPEDLQALKSQAEELKGQDSLAFVILTFDVADREGLVDAQGEINDAVARKVFAENIWLFVELPTRDHPAPELEYERTWKKPRLDEDSFILWSIFDFKWWFPGNQPKLLLPIPKSQTVLTEGNVTIYAGDGVSVGMSEFSIIVNGGFSFVDKTLLISEFIESSTTVALVVRPRRFGKTTNLTMLKNFFSFPIHPDNKKRRLELFKGSKIQTQNPRLFKQYFCKFPVIFISFKDFHDCNTWERMQAKVRGILAALYKEHIYLYDRLDQIEKKRFNLVRTEEKYPRMGDALKDLSEYLTDYYGRQCIVLIDEYDHPLDVAFHHNFYPAACDHFSTLLGSLLKDNDLNVKKGLLVGVNRVAKTGYLSDFNNVKVYPMFARRFSDKFGFTEEEVATLLRHHKKDEYTDEVKEWYDHYKVADDTHLYNPWSVINFINEGTLESHWTATGNTRTIKKLIWYSGESFKEEAALLIENGTIDVELKNNLSYEDLFLHHDDALWTLLYYAGYLTHDADPYSTGTTSYDRDTYNRHMMFNDAIAIKVRIPNNEVFQEWVGWLQVPNAPKLSYVVCTLLDGKLGEFHDLLFRTVIGDLSFNDVGGSNSGKKSETFYHGYMLGWLAQARFNGCSVKSNREGGLGRYDALIESLRDRKAALMEYKIRKNTHKPTIEAKAEEGLTQIERKRYRSEVSDEIEQLVELGIAFQGKMVAVVGKVYEKTDGIWVENEYARYNGKGKGSVEDGDDDV
ncbi:hypothetical protein BC938DRAFT_482649 [Jimgerdemannia flammicorona]|uniref:AAA-ATPase-like domain-containing protein n=1 Tax=Jimgerdemannia flammicorona TaxID=994334 RepID=A0A433QDJ5_9FUNG|nr:hypothetical protein BC938DRAFT_482649 [Jimgerdemannia flammicorona]